MRRKRDHLYSNASRPDSTRLRTLTFRHSRLCQLRWRDGNDRVGEKAFFCPLFHFVLSLQLTRFWGSSAKIVPSNIPVWVSHDLIARCEFQRKRRKVRSINASVEKARCSPKICSE